MEEFARVLGELSRQGSSTSRARTKWTCEPCGEGSTSLNCRGGVPSSASISATIPPPKCPHYWFVVEPDADLPELCSLEPRRDVDLYVETGVVLLGAILEGRSSIEREKDEKEKGGLFLSGYPGHARSMDRWLRTSVYATLEPSGPVEPSLAERCVEPMRSRSFL
ncbi:hypothetical protein [Mesorhizobium sp. LjNodule214]|uniref:hypothetical protein n=1 Tax=Mesorhizobium sp. LjNodule214 TaxID=3342252 RepID=UPI003ECCAD2F